MRAARSALAAVAFLTRVPVGRWVELDGDDVARAGWAFPLVGLGIGAAVGAVADGLSGPLTPLLAALLGVALGAVLTGALHLDALADTADALGGSTREGALEIMRDHRIGAYGALALVLDVGIKAAAIAVLDVEQVAAAFCLARAVPVALGAALPYARTGEGIGRATTGTGVWQVVVSAAIAVAACVLLGSPWLALVGVAALGICGLTARRWLGGVTGDVLGAAGEVTELAALVTAVALVS
jgi:adenosylcobinamide-GDP ribazoletransferase